MLEVPFRHRPLLLLTAALLLQILLLAFQIRRGDNARLIRIWAVEIVTPWQRAGTWVGRTLHSGWTDYVDLHHARVENQQLREQMGQLAIRNQQLESQAREQERLERLLNFRETYPNVNMLAAEVIGANADASSRTLYINRGQRDGLVRDMGVITPEGVAGKILEVFSGTAQVLLISDKESGVGAMLASSRTHGVVRGLGQTQLRMDYVPNDEKMSNGEAVVTSGDDQIFPKDLPIGTVTGASAGNPFKTIFVQPAVRLDRLEEVLVLLGRDELVPQNKAEGSESGGAPETSAPTAASGVPQ
jgi:rod shape-determining protein MreC